jgi:hypothetical protein
MLSTYAFFASFPKTFFLLYHENVLRIALICCLREVEAAGDNPGLVADHEGGSIEQFI